MIRCATISLMLLWFSATGALAVEFRHVGDFMLQSHFKITGDQMTPIPMKAMVFRVFTDGIVIRISADGDDDAFTTFEIYRSDGIGRQRSEGGALEVIPGVQATSRNNNVLRHLRMSAESLTITTFPGVSDQTIVSYAVAAERIEQPQPPTPSE
ncbi:MAG: hypothetical protein ACNA8L_12515 [Luteolibacter sp.]|jgi:hypothetical protein